MNAAWKSLAAALAAAPLMASATESAEPTLEQRLEQAEQRIAILERKLEIATESAATTAKSAPVVKAAPTGISLTAADSSIVIKLRGNLAVDGCFFLDQNTPPTADTFLLRRARSCRTLT